MDFLCYATPFGNFPLVLMRLKAETTRIEFDFVRPFEHQIPLRLTQSRLSARRGDTTAARLAEGGRRWCHCL